MKEHWSIGNKKVSSLEEGLISAEEIPCAKYVNTNKTWKQSIQFVKLILYLELVLFVGWLCYSMLQAYRAESMQAKNMDNIGKAESQNLFGHSAYDKTTNSHDYSYQVDNIMMKNMLLDDLVNSKEASKMKNNESDNKESDIVTTTMENNLQNNEEREGKYKEQEETNEKDVHKEVFIKEEEQEEKNKEQEEKNEEQGEENKEQVKNEEEEKINEEEEEKKEEQVKNEEQGKENEEQITNEEEENKYEVGNEEYTELEETNEEYTYKDDTKNEEQVKNEERVKNEEEEANEEELERRKNEEEEANEEELERRKNEEQEKKDEFFDISNVDSEDSLRNRFVGVLDSKWNENSSDSLKSPEIIAGWGSVEPSKMQDCVNSSKSQEMEYERAEKFENYLLFSLILENAMRDTEADEVAVADGHEWQDNTTPSNERRSEESMNENEQSRIVMDVDSVEGVYEDTSASAKNSGDNENASVDPNVREDEQKELESSMDTNESTKVEEHRPELDMQNPEEDYYNKQIQDEGESSEISELENFGSNTDFDLSDYDLDRDPSWDAVEAALLKFRELGVQPLLTPSDCEEIYSRHSMKSLLCNNRMELWKRSNPETPHTSQDHIGIYANNGEEKSNDHIAPQLLKEKIQNDVVSGSVHRVARHILKYPNNEGISVDTNDMKVIPERPSVSLKKAHTHYSDSDEIVKENYKKFYEAMDRIAYHIDVLENMLLRFNNLTDDYASKEMSS